jgi:hypothetical protein
MNIMPSRYKGLNEALIGYKKSGVPLVGYDGNSFKHPQFGDDEGIYYFVPKMADMFNLEIGQALMIFQVGIIVISFILGIVGSFLILKTKAARILSVFYLSMLSFIAFKAGDIYIVSSSIVISLIPLFLYFIRDQRVKTPLYIYLFIAGVLISMSNFVRAYSGFGVMIFIGIAIAFSHMKGKKKLVVISIIVSSVLLTSVYFKSLMVKRDEFLQKQQLFSEEATGRHVIWHSVYIGLGFIDNPYVEAYLDESAKRKVRSIDPSVKYLSNEYGRILRNETIKIIVKNPLFFMINLSAKAGVIMFYLMIFANVGLLLLIFRKRPLEYELSFWVTMIFYLFIGILVVPHLRYLLGFVSFRDN